MKAAFIKRIFGVSEAKHPKDPSCWKYSNGRVEIKWARAPELQEPCSAIRLEGRGLPEKILVFHGTEGQHHAFRNRSSYWGSRLDPIPDTTKLRCRGILISIYDYAGNVMSGPAKEPLKSFRVRTEKCKMIIIFE